MNRKELIEFFGHPKTQLALQLNIEKQQVQQWLNGGLPVKRTREICDLCVVNVAEIFYDDYFDDYFDEPLKKQLNIAIESLKTQQETAELIGQIIDFGKKRLTEIPSPENLI